MEKEQRSTNFESETESDAELQADTATDPAPDHDITEWVTEYGDRLFNFAMMRLKNKALAEDIVQETFLSAFKSQSSFEGRSSVYTWLVRILKNKIIDHIRKQSRKSEVSYEEVNCPEKGDLINNKGIWKAPLGEWAADPGQLLDKKGFQVQIQKCLETIPEKYREAFVLKMIDDMEAEEVCDMLGISSNNLWVIMYRARMRLRACLDKHWFNADEQGGNT